MTTLTKTLAKPSIVATLVAKIKETDLPTCPHWTEYLRETRDN